MNWLNKLERRFGRYAIRGLMTYIVFLTGIAFLLSYVNHGFLNNIILVPELVYKGEVWRLFTYIFIPPSLDILWIIFTLYFYYLVGNSLEGEWGSFRFNMYYLLGMLGTTIGALLTGYGTPLYLNLSLFLAFAHEFPDYELMLFFILPVKVKYMAWLQWIYLGYTVLTQPLPYKVAAVVSIINYFIFFGGDLVRHSKKNRQVYSNRKRFRSDIPGRKESIHRCAVCGKTEKDDPKMDFRYCVECDGDYEYCMEHLRNHEHVKINKVIEFPRKEE